MTDIDALIAAIDAQESHALQALYDLYGRQVFSLALSVTHEREAAEEVTQDVFLKVWHKVAQYRKGTNFRAWLLRITRNQAIDRLRQDKKNTERTFIWNIENLASPDHFPDDDLRWVQQALRQLSEGQRQSIELAFLQGMTHEQIAAQLNTPLGTIKTRIRDGLRKLREAWEGENQP